MQPAYQAAPASRQPKYQSRAPDATQVAVNVLHVFRFATVDVARQIEVVVVLGIDNLGHGTLRA